MKTELTAGCLAMDREDNAYRVIRLNAPEQIRTDIGPIQIQTVEVSDLDGQNRKTLPVHDLERAEVTAKGAALLGRKL